MPAYLPYEVRGAIIQVFGRAFHYKNNVFDFMAGSGVPEEVFDRYRDDVKFNIARQVIRDLEQMGDEGRMIQRRLLSDLCALRRAPDIAADPDEATDALRKLKEVAVQHDLLAQEERSEAVRRDTEAKRRQQDSKETRLAVLHSTFVEMTSAADRQARGYDLERLLTEMFGLSGIRYRPPYRADGEQIDGSFHFRGFDYIVEARWRAEPTTLNDVMAFKGKVNRKIESTRGLFASVEGFVPGIDERLRQAAPANVILMDGSDLVLILEGRIDLADALDAKADKASQEGRLFYQLQESVRPSKAATASLAKPEDQP